MAHLLYQGHGSFRLETDAGRIIYVDPFAGQGYDLPADLILVTHDHYDHNRRSPGKRRWKEGDTAGSLWTISRFKRSLPATPTTTRPVALDLSSSWTG